MKSAHNINLKETTVSAIMVIDAMKAIIAGKGYDFAEAQRSLLDSEVKRSQEGTPLRSLNCNTVDQTFNNLKNIVEKKIYVRQSDMYRIENYGLNDHEVLLFNENFNIFLHTVKY